MVCRMPKASRTRGAGLLKRIKLFQDPALYSIKLPTSLICPIDPIPVSMACVTFCLFHSDSKAHFNRWCVPINILLLGVRLIYCNKNSMITLLKYDCQNNCHCYSSKDLFRVIFIVKHNSHRRCSQGCYSREVLLYHFVCLFFTHCGTGWGSKCVEKHPKWQRSASLDVCCR